MSDAVSMKTLPAGLETAWRVAARQWDEADGSRRLFSRDATLWTDSGEQDWLGWLDAARREGERMPRWLEWQRGLPQELDHVVLLGMGGSSLGPEVIAAVLARALDEPGARRPELVMLDTTDPGAVARTRARLDPARSLVVASSKSGTTLETALLLDLFEEWLRDGLSEGAGDRLVAVTDPGSVLEKRAREHGFRDVFLGEPTIGGRFSVLSPFGLVPAAALGLDLERLLAPLAAMTTACRDLPAEQNPGVALGLLLGVAAREGRDKITLLSEEPLSGFGGWLEQLLAESTGKLGRGLVPIDREPAEPPSWRDRLGVSLSLVGADRGVPEGVPGVEIRFGSRWQLAAEFFRWQIATAVAGSLLGVDPFDQPDVEAAKVRTRELTDRAEAGGELEPERPRIENHGMAVFTPGRAAELPGSTIEEIVGAHLGTLGEGDYFALLAFVDPTPPVVERLQAIRERVLVATGRATTLGFGPRYLHSTGQLHKGGPNDGVFLVLTDRARPEIPVPGRALTLGQVRDAQALGDVAVLAERGRRVLRLRLDDDASRALDRLVALVREALA